MSAYRDRLSRIEAAMPPPLCPECRGYPARIIGLNDAGELISETVPRTGCPVCGAPVHVTAAVVGVDVARL